MSLAIQASAVGGLAGAAFDPASGGEGLAGGRFEAPAWVIAALGVAVVLLGVAHFVARARRGRRGPR